MKQDKLIAVVTGANRGIGLEICRQLGSRGVRVILTARDADKGEAARKHLEGRGVQVEFKPLDVARPESIEDFRNYAAKELPRLDILVNNAGVIGDARGASNTGASVIREVMETNVHGPWRLSQALLPLLRKSRNGRIVNMSSGMGALDGMGGGYGAYRVSKTALNGFTAALAAELADTKICVNTMCPGWVRTDMGGAEAPRSAEEGADTAVWLALDAPADLTGKFLRDRKIIPW